METNTNYIISVKDLIKEYNDGKVTALSHCNLDVKKGEVVAIGHGTKDEEMVLKVGDTVLYGKYAGTELDVEGTKYLIMRQSDVLAVLG